MYRNLDDVALKSGERMQIACITGPEPAWTQRVLPVLYHKGESWVGKMREALDEGIPPATMSFYIGLVDDLIVGNITTTTACDGQVGLLQHVFTPPEQRRKGICTHLMRALTEDFRARGGRALSLGTGYDTPPYWIYHSFGFRGILDSGHMVWRLEEDFDERWFAPGPTRVREVNHADWALLEFLYCNEQGWRYRSAYFSQIGFGEYEGRFIPLLEGIESGRIAQHRILESEAGAVVGQAYLWRDDRFADVTFGGTTSPTMVLDLFVHPAFEDSAGGLIGELSLAGYRKVQAYADADATGKVSALMDAGFAVEATLRGQVEYRGEVTDIIVLARAGG